MRRADRPSGDGGFSVEEEAMTWSVKDPSVRARRPAPPSRNAPGLLIPAPAGAGGLPPSRVGSVPLALPAPFPIAAPSRLALKRAADIVLAAAFLVASAPLLLLAAVLIKLTSPGPVLFIQRRSGQLGREFRMLKLRTMTQGAEKAQDALAESLGDRRFLKLENDPRVTPVGRILRRLSIDEIPQFVNVIKGDMSLIGPRPLLPCDVRYFPRDERARRFDMRPGITGLWQVSGRSSLSDDERMALDLEYVDRWSLRLDLEILARTPAVVLTARGAC
jgi:lipopolysaccharide/colanic/teichoic acid biosynthesis glycosyltransferase